MSWWSDRAQLDSIIDQVMCKGILMSRGSYHGFTNLSVTLSPSLFPRELFELAVQVQPSFNLVLDAVSRDTLFMKETFERLAQYDSFIKSLYEIFLHVQNKGNVQTTALGIHRADYLVDVKESLNKNGFEMEMKQVEINTIASGLVAHSDLVSQFHKYVHERFSENEIECTLPANGSLTKVTDGIAAAFKAYGKKSSYILFVVQKNEWNIFDQRHMEFDLWERHSIPVIRRTLKEVSEQSRLTESRELFIKDKEVALIYYRAGYSPNDYPTDSEWHARKIMELSRASNCPSVAYQLIGSKKIQQLLSQDGVLEKYCTDPIAAENMRRTFVNQYSLEEREAVQNALQHPDLYVLKPQREGGGNNLYGANLRQRLSEVANTSERNAYILMDLINSPSLWNAMLKRGETKATEHQLISEMGIFGVFVRKDDEILVNGDAGCLLRSKPTGYNEGGVSVGIAAVDSPCLVSNDVYMKHCCLIT